MVPVAYYGLLRLSVCVENPFRRELVTFPCYEYVGFAKKECEGFGAARATKAKDCWWQ
jgi:hypothetical protein